MAYLDQKDSTEACQFRIFLKEMCSSSVHWFTIWNCQCAMQIYIDVQLEKIHLYMINNLRTLTPEILYSVKMSKR